MALIRPEEIHTLARLAQLELGPEEQERMARELEGILGYVRKLEELDLTSVPPTTQVQFEIAEPREDVLVPSLPLEVTLREAPAVSEGSFSVPAFVDEG